MSVAELIHSNLCLLGYEKEASAAKIILSDETFEHANERAFQSVVHFLLRSLDEERCRLAFRHCWPVLDKKQSSVFRQGVVGWLRELRQTDPDGSSLPQINPALFLSPGGRRFKDLLLSLTQFVMLKSLQKLDAEAPAGDREQILSKGDPEIQCGTLRAAGAIAKDRFVQTQKKKLAVHTEHQRFADSFSTQYRRLRQSISSLTVELGRLVAVSELPPELTHRLLQENAEQVVPAVYAASRQRLAALVAPRDRLHRFAAETEYSWRVVDSIASGAVEKSAVDAGDLVTREQTDQGAQSGSDMLVDGKLDLLTFFDTFVGKVEHLRQSLSLCAIGDLKGLSLCSVSVCPGLSVTVFCLCPPRSVTVFCSYPPRSAQHPAVAGLSLCSFPVRPGLHGTLPPLVREATQLSADAGQLLARLETETESTSRRVERLLSAEPPPPPARARGRTTTPSPPPLLAPRTPNWSLSGAPVPPPADHPLKHMYRSPATGGLKLDLEQGADADPSCSSRLSSLTSVTGGGGSPWASPVAAPPAVQLTGPSPRPTEDRPSPAAVGDLFRPPPEPAWGDTETRLTPTPGRAGRSATGLSSCSSLFSPLRGEAGSAARSSVAGSVSSLDSVLETARPGGDGSRARSPVSRGAADSPGLTPATPVTVGASAAGAGAGAGGAGGTTAAPVVHSPSPQVMRLREQTSAFLRSLTLSPVAGGDSVFSPAPLELSAAGGGAWLSAHGQRSRLDGRLSRSGPSSPQGAALPRVAWQDGTRLLPGPGSPVAAELSQTAGTARRRSRSGPGTTHPPLSPNGVWTAELGTGVNARTPEENGVGVRTPEKGLGFGARTPGTKTGISPAAAAGVPASPPAAVGSPAGRSPQAEAVLRRSPQAEPVLGRSPQAEAVLGRSPQAEAVLGRSPQAAGAEEPPVTSETDFSHLDDEMAEALALSVFGPGDFNQSLNFSHRESLGGVELSLVELDDSISDTVPAAAPSSGRVEPPTDVLIDI
ncbi:HAUS augmin-like complex subunit 6 [Amphibalanus amphitrite]|uniref:HAUS augmin-like complex subunit 6 n=1 Tax=Amphibalanus amphitrite TaxID=1232801 RepID=A0A6A4WI18_AMPAM|nr:HAUS augmin-like complex subunit 6 [Amphibalanus amphitrite]KAF0303485.1 HAUS augmin-like complex subunit 6 [Amphibalanus amphitrite]KAF0303486.1 HAUS augmin-like complex subunit 6 [Amphibalanus amphitrite]